MSEIIVTPEFINLESPPVMRALLRHIVEHADIIGEDIAGLPVLRLEFSCAPWLIDKLAAFDASREDHEAEPDKEL